MIKTQFHDQQITYENYGFTRRMVKAEAPRFKVDPITHRDARMGEDIITNSANIGPGTVFRGALESKAKASPLTIQVSHTTPYQISTSMSPASNLIVAISGAGNPNHLNGWQLYGEFPIRDRLATHNALVAPTGITVDAGFIWVAQGARLFRMTHDFSSIIEITPSATAIPAINGLASDGNHLYTVDGTAFYRIIVTGTTYTFSTLATLAFPIAKIGCFTGQYFIGHDSASSLIRQWQMSGELWRSIPFSEPNFMGALMLNGFVYLARQIGTLPEIQLLPARI